jgi:hypothetical protein
MLKPLAVALPLQVALLAVLNSVNSLALATWLLLTSTSANSAHKVQVPLPQLA